MTTGAMPGRRMAIVTFAVIPTSDFFQRRLRELGVSRKSIYQWRNRYRADGSNALRGRGGMSKAEHSAHEERPGREKEPAKEARRASMEELARARRRIAALERKIRRATSRARFFSASLAGSQ